MVLLFFVNQECSGISLGEEELRNQLRMLERFPVQKVVPTGVGTTKGRWTTKGRFLNKTL